MSRRRAAEARPALDLRPLDAGALDGRLKQLARELAPRVAAEPRPARQPPEPIPLDARALIRELRGFLGRN